MIRRIDLRGRLAEGERPDYRTLVPRAEFDVEAAVEIVRPTLDDIRHRGAPAVLEAVRRFDHIELAHPRVPVQAIDDALAALDADVRAGFVESIDRLRAVSEAEREPTTSVEVVTGGRVTQRLVPYERVGVYVPAGVTALASSVVMTVVPARVAGVRSIALASPGQIEHGGLPHPTVLAVCGLLGIDEVYAVGGVAAVGMFAYGTDHCPPVDYIAGPGRITTVAAKRAVSDRVGIDSEAGPTEIAILADDTAEPAYLAADLISQAEHDEMAAAVLVTPSEELADAVVRELGGQVPRAKHAERIGRALGGQQSAVVLVDDTEQGLAVVDGYAAEHLQIQTAGAEMLAGRVSNAGAIFVGPWSPVSLGDYCAGSNHVLPTGRYACRSSGLSVRSYLRAVHVVEYDRAALAAASPYVVALAEAEDLPAHAAAVTIRESERAGDTRPAAASPTDAPPTDTPPSDTPLSDTPPADTAPSDTPPARQVEAEAADAAR